MTRHAFKNCKNSEICHLHSLRKIKENVILLYDVKDLKAE